MPIFGGSLRIKDFVEGAMEEGLTPTGLPPIWGFSIIHTTPAPITTKGGWHAN